MREEAEGHTVWEAAQGPQVPTCVAEMEVLVETVSAVQVAAIVLQELVLAPTAATRRAPIDVVVVELGVTRSGDAGLTTGGACRWTSALATCGG